MKTEADVRGALRQWIAAASKKVEPAQIADDTAIIEQRLITSIQVMDLILFIEKLSGRRLELEDLKAGSFRDINSLYRTFFGGTH
jgi:acyl carrier protein